RQVLLEQMQHSRGVGDVPDINGLPGGAQQKAPGPRRGRRAAEATPEKQTQLPQGGAPGKSLRRPSPGDPVAGEAWPGPAHRGQEAPPPEWPSSAYSAGSAWRKRDLSMAFM